MLKKCCLFIKSLGFPLLNKRFPFPYFPFKLINIHTFVKVIKRLFGLADVGKKEAQLVFFFKSFELVWEIIMWYNGK